MGILDFLRRSDEPKKLKYKNLYRSYGGANSGRLYGDFVASSFSADSELKNALPVLRNRSRDLARNNEYAKRFLNLIKTNVVGEKGFNAQVRARNPDMGLDAAGNKIIEDAFLSWGRLGNADVTGRLSWLDCQRVAAETLARDGEVFIKLIRNNQYQNSFTLQFIEADLVDDQENGRNEANGNEIRMGVELDSFHRPVAYHVLTSHPNDSFLRTPQARNHVRVPASEMIHIFMPVRTHQTRGEPFMAPAITGLKMLDGFAEASLVAARAAASKFAVLTSPSGEDFVGDDESDDDMPVVDFEPASIFQLPQGQDLKLIDPNHPTTTFDEFQKAILRGIASGLNVSYTSLSNDLTGVSYSSIRQGTIEERDHFKMLQSFMIQHFCEPVFRAWLETTMTVGDVPIPIDKFDKFSNGVVFRGRGFAWVDPQREINANITAVSNGIVSLSDIAANYGRDVEDVFAQIQSDKEMAERYGLKLAFEPFGNKLPVEADIDGAENGD
jgi:lambda family phage portal protein